MKHLTGLFGAWMLIFNSCTRQPAPLPNVLLFVADDIGLGDLGYYHREHTGTAPQVETPHLDALLAKGIRFEDAHAAASLCAPSRVALLSGQYSFRSETPFGTWSAWRKPQLGNEQFESLAAKMKDQRYHTSFFGKFGIGGSFPSKDSVTIRTYGPRQLGFDYSFELPAGIQGPPLAYYENEKWLPLSPDAKLVPLDFSQHKIIEKSIIKILGDDHWDPALAGKKIVQACLNFLERFHREEQSPFFMYYAAQAIHLPHFHADTIGNRAFGDELGIPKLDMIKELDLQVGSIINQLKELGLYDNKLIIFTSDNGGLINFLIFASDNGGLINFHPDNSQNSSLGYRGNKGQVYEGGHRVPLIISWPEQITKPVKIDALTTTLDIFPTLMELTGAIYAFDGKSLLPSIRGLEQKEETPYLIHLTNKNLAAIRMGDWKVIYRTNRKLNTFKVKEIYNLKENPGEQQSGNYFLQKQNPAVQEVIALTDAIIKREFR